MMHVYACYAMYRDYFSGKHSQTSCVCLKSQRMLPGWWFKPEYIINELNINAAIHQPRAR